MGVDVNRNFMAEDTTILFDTMLSQDELLDASLQQNTLLLLTQKNKTLSELELKKTAKQELSLSPFEYRIRVHQLQLQHWVY